MSRNRLLKYINFLIGLAVIAALGLGYWFLYRPLPKTSGRIKAPIHEAARIERDQRGVPHITAGSIEDVVFLQGFATAQDRLFQMDMARRRAAGELAEILGPGALGSDREARRLRMRHIAETHYQSMSAGDRKALAAYARGVNFFLETNRSRLPVDFSILDYDPRPWSVVDSILAGLQVFRTLSNTWGQEILKQSYLSQGKPEKVRALFPLRSGPEAHPGSNAWAVAGAWSASGKPLLANDSHLEFSVPCFWYQVHLKSPDLDVAGVSVPGLPGVVSGHNQRIAWGATNLGFDVQDLYMERLDPRTGRYAYQGQLHQARLEREVIPVRGGKPVEMAIWVTRHGPVVMSQRDLHLALRWSAAERGSFACSFLELDQARDWKQFRAALARFPGPPQNFVYADVDGNIGCQAAGKLPIRNSHDGDLPVDGASGRFEWDGFIPFEQLPSVFNPPGGIVISANQDPFPEDYPFRVNGSFAPGYRARRIRELLTVKKKWKAGEFLDIQTDIHDSFLNFLARRLVAAYDARGMRSPSLDEAVELLRKWDGRMEEAQAAPLIATLLYHHVRKAVAEVASPGAGLTYAATMAPVVIERLLRERPEGWFPDYDQLLLRSFVDAVEEGRRMEGDAVSKWSYGRSNQLRLSSGVIERLPLVGRYLRLAPVPLSGSANTVQQTSGRLGPSMRMVEDLADWSQSLLNLTLGESGQRLSSHFRDQWDSYRAGASFPMEYQQVSSKHRLEVQPER